MKTRDFCRGIMERYATSAGLGVMFPLPGLTAVVTLVEVRMVQEIAGAYGEALTRGEAAQWIVLSGVKNYGVKLAGEALLFVPVFGWLARPVLTRWTVEKLAARAIDHFENRHPDAEYEPTAATAEAAAGACAGAVSPGA